MGVITYKCPNCGGGLTFNADIQKYRCEYCLSEFSQEELDEIEKKELEKAEKRAEIQENNVLTEDVPVETSGTQAVQTEDVSENTGRKKTVTSIMYICPSCGAQIVTDETTAASFCYYCHNPVVLEEKLRGEFKPDYILPFQIDKKKAQEIFTQWVGRKKFVPDYFFSPRQIESMTGVYFPYWLYSCKVKGDLQAEGKTVRTWETAGMRYTETKVYDIQRQGDMNVDFRTWETAGMRYTETKVYDIQRQGDMNVDSVARNALKKANRKLIDGVLPYRLNEKKEFSMGYLSGFVAENRDMEKDGFVNEVKEEVRQFALSSLSSQTGNYSSVQVRKNQADITEETWAAALLPVWTVTYNDKARGKIYYFALNGQTGKIWGELPVDNKKLAVLFLSIFVPVCVILLFLGYWIG